MDVSVQLAPAQTAAGLSPMDTGPRGVEARGAGGPSVVPFAEGFNRPRVPGAEPGAFTMIDQVRAEFEAFRLRMSSNRETRYVNGGANPQLAQLTEVMDSAMRTQLFLIEVSVAANAGISAAHQSQGSVKTLVEKSQ